jgi:hypothetical protein
MRRLKGGALVALILLTAVVVVASPAFATPNITASSGNANPVPPNPHSASAVAPFITPSTNTRSLYTGVSRNWQIAFPSLGSTIRCETSNMSFYASMTHTQLRVTDITFSRNCTVSPVGTVDNQPISCTANSRTPWSIHVRAVDGRTRSASGTINVPTGDGAGNELCTIRTTIGGVSQSLSVSRNQSCRASASATGITYTWSRTPPTIDITCAWVVTIQPLRANTASVFSGTYTITPDTARDGVLTVTSSS